MSTANLLCDNVGNRWSDRAVTRHSCMTAGLPTGPAYTGHVVDSVQDVNIHKYTYKSRTQIYFMCKCRLILACTHTFFPAKQHFAQHDICSDIRNLFEADNSHGTPSPLHFLPNQPRIKWPYWKTVFLVPIIVYDVGIRLLIIFSVELKWWIFHLIQMLSLQVPFHVL